MKFKYYQANENKQWRYIEKAIIVFFIAWGLIRLISNAIIVYNLIQDTDSLLFPDYTKGAIILACHPILLVSFLTFLSGIFLLLRLRTGWVLSVSIVIAHIFIVVSSAIVYFLSAEGTSLNGMALGIGLTVLFSTALIILLQKQFTIRINPLRKDSLFILLLVLLLLADYMYFTYYF